MINDTYFLNNTNNIYIGNEINENVAINATTSTSTVKVENNVLFGIFDRYTIILISAFFFGLLLIGLIIFLVICICKNLSSKVNNSKTTIKSTKSNEENSIIDFLQNGEKDKYGFIKEKKENIELMQFSIENVTENNTHKSNYLIKQKETDENDTKFFASNMSLKRNSKIKEGTIEEENIRLLDEEKSEHLSPNNFISTSNSITGAHLTTSNTPSITVAVINAPSPIYINNNNNNTSNNSNYSLNNGNNNKSLNRYSKIGAVQSAIITKRTKSINELESTTSSKSKRASDLSIHSNLDFTPVVDVIEKLPINPVKNEDQDLTTSSNVLTNHNSDSTSFGFKNINSFVNNNNVAHTLNKSLSDVYREYAEEKRKETRKSSESINSKLSTKTYESEKSCY